MKLEARDIRVGYGEGDVLRGVSAAIRPGEVVGVIGPNGCGKSTLLRVLGRLLRPRAGRVELDGTPIGRVPRRELARRLAVLPQEPSTPPMATVRELVAMGRHPHHRFAGVLPTGLDRDDRAAIDRAMRATEVHRLADRVVNELSGGERRRAWIAVCLAQDASVLLLDEPVTALDIRHQLEVMALLESLARERSLAIGVIIHDLDLAARSCSRLVAMREGTVEAEGPPREVLTAPLLGRVFGVRGAATEDTETGELTCRVRLDPGDTRLGPRTSAGWERPAIGAGDPGLVGPAR